MGEDLVRRLGDAGYTVIVKLHDRSRDLQPIHSGGVDRERGSREMFHEPGTATRRAVAELYTLMELEPAGIC